MRRTLASAVTGRNSSSSGMGSVPRGGAHLRWGRARQSRLQSNFPNSEGEAQPLVEGLASTSCAGAPW